MSDDFIIYEDDVEEVKYEEITEEDIIGENYEHNFGKGEISIVHNTRDDHKKDDFPEKTFLNPLDVKRVQVYAIFYDQQTGDNYKEVDVSNKIKWVNDGMYFKINYGKVFGEASKFKSFRGFRIQTYGYL